MEYLCLTDSVLDYCYLCGLLTIILMPVGRTSLLPRVIADAEGVPRRTVISVGAVGLPLSLGLPCGASDATHPSALTAQVSWPQHAVRA